MPNANTTVFTSRFSRGLAIVIGVGCVAAVIALGVTASADGLLQSIAPLFLVAFTAWALFWQPAVTVDDEVVELRNPFRTIRIDWSAIANVDTRWALAIQTHHGNYTAWAAPASGRHGLYRITAVENRRLAESTYLAGTIRTGDALSSDSGQAAQIVRARWEYLRDRGRIPQRNANERPQTRVHWITIAVFVVAGAATALSLGY